MASWDEQQLKKIVKKKQLPPAAGPLKNYVNSFMKKVVYPRQKKIAALANAWQEMMPPEMLEHTCLEDFSRGTLRVIVDSSSHLAELNLMIREGLDDQLRQLCPNVPLSRIKVVRGQWYHTNNDDGNIIPDF